jgi:hypothetical protein
MKDFPQDKQGSLHKPWSEAVDGILDTQVRTAVRDTGVRLDVGRFGGWTGSAVYLLPAGNIRPRMAAASWSGTGSAWA